MGGDDAKDEAGMDELVFKPTKSTTKLCYLSFRGVLQCAQRSTVMAIELCANPSLITLDFPITVPPGSALPNI
jgi:hypothetical protein